MTLQVACVPILGPVEGPAVAGRLAAREHSLPAGVSKARVLRRGQPEDRMLFGADARSWRCGDCGCNVWPSKGKLVAWLHASPAFLCPGPPPPESVRTLRDLHRCLRNSFIDNCLPQFLQLTTTSLRVPRARSISTSETLFPCWRRAWDRSLSRFTVLPHLGQVTSFERRIMASREPSGVRLSRQLGCTGTLWHS